jgi:exopolysaccharide production protein ExoQ
MWNFAEKLYVVLALVYFTGAIIPTVMGLKPGGEAIGFSDIRLLLLEITIYIVMVFFLLLRFNRATRLILPQLWLSALLVWTVASVAWSEDPERTIKKAIVVCFTTVFGIYFGTCFTLRQQMRFVAVALGVLAVLSALCAVLLPHYGVTNGTEYAGAAGAGAWKGVFQTKNQLGKAMVLMCICCVCLWSSRQARRSSIAFMFILAVTLLVLSRAAASAVALIFLLSLVPLIRILRWRASNLVPAVLAISVAFAGIATFVVDNSATLLALLGRNATLTGRIPLWGVVLRSISRRPFLGYGYAGFWKGMHGPSAYVRESVGWDVPHAHNGFLDVWLDLGAVGLILFSMLLFTSFLRAVRTFRDGHGYDSLWPLMVLSCMLLFNLTESTALLPNSLYWILLVACTTPNVVRRREAEPGRAPLSDLAAPEMSVGKKRIFQGGAI